MIWVEFMFFRAHWVNRLLTRNRYGHVALRLPSGLILNCSRLPEYVGVLEEYPEAPDRIVGRFCDPRNVEAALYYCETPTSLLSIFRRNCVRQAALALTGDERNIQAIRRMTNE